jgi:hypothetical protein
LNAWRVGWRVSAIQLRWSVCPSIAMSRRSRIGSGSQARPVRLLSVCRIRVVWSAWKPRSSAKKDRRLERLSATLHRLWRNKNSQRKAGSVVPKTGSCSLTMTARFAPISWPLLR